MFQAYVRGYTPQNMALYGTVPPFEDPEIPIDQGHPGTAQGTALLQDLSSHVQREILRVHHATDEGQPARHQVLVPQGDTGRWWRSQGNSTGYGWFGDWISMGFLSFLVDFHIFAMDFYGFRLISMRFCGFWCVFFFLILFEWVSLRLWHFNGPLINMIRNDLWMQMYITYKSVCVCEIDRINMNQPYKKVACKTHHIHRCHDQSEIIGGNNIRCVNLVSSHHILLGSNSCLSCFWR